MSNSAPRPSKNERREAAREKARELREQQKKREKRNRLFMIGGISLGSLAVLGLIAAIILPSVFRAPAEGPANMATNGVKFTQGLTVETAAAKPADAAPADPTPNAEGVVSIRVFVDYLCPYCGQFEQTNAEQIKGWVQDGSATLEIHPIAILDRASQGTKYSTRAANAMACVVNYAPNSAFDFSAALFQQQPAESTPGLDDATLISIASSAGASGAQIEKCIKDTEFSAFVEESTKQALAGPIADSDVEKVSGTPLVIVNGKQYKGSVSSAEDFAAFVLAQTATSQSTPTPTPTESVTPSPTATP